MNSFTPSGAKGAVCENLVKSALSACKKQLRIKSNNFHLYDSLANVILKKKIYGTDNNKFTFKCCSTAFITDVYV